MSDTKLKPQEPVGRWATIKKNGAKVITIATITWALVSALGATYVLINHDRTEAFSWAATNTTQTLQGKKMFWAQATNWTNVVPKDQSGQ